MFHYIIISFKNNFSKTIWNPKLKHCLSYFYISYFALFFLNVWHLAFKENKHTRSDIYYYFIYNLSYLDIKKCRLNRGPVIDIYCKT